AEKGRFRDWLGTVTHNKIKRFLAKKTGKMRAGGDTVERGALDTVAAPLQETNWMEDFQRHILKVALEHIRPSFEKQMKQTWRAFELVWLENRPAQEVAQELHLDIDKVYVAKSRVLKRLQEEVRHLAEDSDLFGG